MRVALAGATGRMGKLTLEAAAERPDVEVALAVNRGAEEGLTLEGVPIERPEGFGERLAEREPDALVEFSGPDSAVAYVEAAADAGVPAVVGATGFTDEQFDRLWSAAERIPVLHDNFSRGIQALLAALRAALPRLPGYDVEVTETHHNAKRDAPSGTAKIILDAVDDARGEAAGRVHGREGMAPREEGEVGVHARRAGDVAADHEVLVAGNHEVLTIEHHTGSPAVFAEGALDAAAWLADREPGRYEFADVVES